MKPLKVYPHAALALATSTAATWGTASGRDSLPDGDSTTDAPNTDLEDLESTFSFDDDYAIGPLVPSELEEDKDTNEEAEQHESLKEEAEHYESLKEEATHEDADDEDVANKTTTQSPRRHRRRRHYGLTARFVAECVIPMWCANAMSGQELHMTDLDLNAMQQMQMESTSAAEPGKTIVPPEVVRKAEGADLDAWILAAQAEHDRFSDIHAVQTATPSEIAAYGHRPLPMLNVWTRTDEDFRKCRACIAGNFQRFDPSAQRWTAQAEPSSIFISTKLAAMRRWKISKVDVKAAFLNAHIPEDELILVSPPAQWIAWGIVPKGTVWRLNRAVYGLRQSPKWWADERDEKLRNMSWTLPSTSSSTGFETFHLVQNVADTQVWSIRSKERPEHIIGMVCVYVDDMLIMAESGLARDEFVKALTSLWAFGSERVLSLATSLTFLSLDFTMNEQGDIILGQARFTRELLEKYGMKDCNALKCINMEKPPIDEDPRLPMNCNSFRPSQVHSTGLLHVLVPTSRTLHHYCHQALLTTPNGPRS